MSDHEPIREGQILTGALFSEPMRIEEILDTDPKSAAALPSTRPNPVGVHDLQCSLRSS
jgi:hypothetical protein